MLSQEIEQPLDLAVHERNLAGILIGFIPGMERLGRVVSRMRVVIMHPDKPALAGIGTQPFQGRVRGEVPPPLGHQHVKPGLVLDVLIVIYVKPLVKVEGLFQDRGADKGGGGEALRLEDFREQV